MGCELDIVSLSFRRVECEVDWQPVAQSVACVPVLCREGAGDAAKEDLEQQVAVLQQRCDALQAEVRPDGSTS